MKTTKEILVEARAVIADREHWTQENMAIENTGLECSPTDDDAWAFCALGAVCKVVGMDDGEDATVRDVTQHLDRAARALYLEPKVVYGIVSLNDGCANPDRVPDAHAAVLRCYDYAIEHAS